jgi:hypothetical protein
MSTSYVFVKETGDPTDLNKKSVRRKIRSKARAHVLVEQLSQHPIVVVKDGRDLLLENSNGRPAGAFRRHATALTTTTARFVTVTFAKSSSKTESNRVLNADASRNISRSLHATGYERARITYNADMLLLSALTTVHLGRGGSLALGEKGSRLVQWMKQSKESSYLDFVPLYYDRSRLVQVVVDCLLCRICLSSTTQNEAQSRYLMLHLYSKVLKEMQQALDSPQRRMQSDVLLATAILQLIEVGRD